MNLLVEYKSVLGWGPPIHDGSRYLLLVSLLLFLMPRAFNVRFLALVIALVVFYLPLQGPKKGGFTLTVLDVGQGSSALIETQSHSVLVDTGSRFLSGMTLADFVVLPFLQQRNIKKLDMLHLTHDDLDHSGGKELLSPKSHEVIGQQR